MSLHGVIFRGLPGKDGRIFPFLHPDDGSNTLTVTPTPNPLSLFSMVCGIITGIWCGACCSLSVCNDFMKSLQNYLMDGCLTRRQNMTLRIILTQVKLILTNSTTLTLFHTKYHNHHPPHFTYHHPHSGSTMTLHPTSWWSPLFGDVKSCICLFQINHSCI